jgi:hypothetical protein
MEENRESQDIVYEGQNLTVKERLSENDAHNVLVEKTNETSPPIDVSTSSNQQVIPLPEEPPKREEIEFEGQNLTVKERLSENDAQKLPLTCMSDDSSPQVLSSSVAPTHSAAPRSAGTDFPLQDHLEKALFFGFYNEVADELLPTLPPAAQVLYSRLFRLSYGFNRNYCTVSQPLLMERTGLSRNTIRTALQTLVDDSWIQIIGAGNRVSTTYRVILPREKHLGEQSRTVKIDAQKLRVKNRRSEIEGQNVHINNRGAEFDLAEGQKRDRQNLSGSQEKVHTTSNSNDLRQRPSKFDAQDLPALLFTYRSSTLLEKQMEDPHTSDNSMLLSARELIDKFYSLLGQRVSKSKRKKSLDECLSLLQEGFTVEEIDYTISWLITHHPTTGSFSRLPHFIDQALKVRDLQHRTPQDYAPGTHESEDDQRRRQQERDEAQQQERIEAAKASLSPSALAALRKEAEQCVDQEHPNIKFGRDTLVRLKLEDLLLKQYLSRPSEPT